MLRWIPVRVSRYIPIYPEISRRLPGPPPYSRALSPGPRSPSYRSFAFQRVPRSPIGRKPPLICIPAGTQPMAQRAGRTGPGSGGGRMRGCRSAAARGWAGLGWAGLGRALLGLGRAGLRAQGRKGGAQGWLPLPFRPLRRAAITSRTVPPIPAPFLGIAVIWPRGIYFCSDFFCSVWWVFFCLFVWVVFFFLDLHPGGGEVAEQLLRGRQ